MRGEDISEKLDFVSSTPAEAVENIKGSQFYDISPDVFKENKVELSPEVKRSELPPVTTPVVAREIAQSPEHAAALAPDAGLLGWVEEQFARYGQNMLKKGEASKQAVDYTERQFGTIKNAVSRKLGDERRLIDLYIKKGTKGLDEDELVELEGLKLAEKDNFGQKDYGLSGPWETLPAEVAAQIADQGAMIGRQKKTIGVIVGGTTLATTAVGAGVGAAGGFGVGALPGAATGFGIGLKSSIAPAYLVSSFKDAYETTFGSTYGALDDAVGDDGKPLNIDETNKRYIAHGVGVVSGSVAFVADKLLIKKIPWLKKIMSPDAAKEALKNPTLKQAFINIGRAMATEGSEEGVQEVIQILGEEIGNTYKNSEVDFINGLARAGEKLVSDERTQARVGRATLVGAAAGGTFVATGTGIDASVRFALEGRGLENEPVVPRKTVAQKRGEALANPDTKFTPISDVVEAPSPQDQAVEILEFQDVIDASRLVGQSTQLKGIAPEMLSNVRKKILGNYGISHVWLDKEELAQFAGDDEKKLERIRALVDENGVAAAGVNAPMKVEAHKFLDLVDDYPDVSEYARLHPQGPSPNSAKVWAEKKEKADQQRAQILEQLNVAREKSPEERAYNLKVTPDVDDTTLMSTLGSQEVADAYLGVLDVKDTEVKEQIQETKKQKETEDFARFDQESAPIRERLSQLETKFQEIIKKEEELTEDDRNQLDAMRVERTQLEREIRAMRPLKDSRIFTAKNGKTFTVGEIPGGQEGVSDIVVRDENGKEVGALTVVTSEKGYYPGVHVDENFRRLGVASAMYDYAESKDYFVGAANDTGSVRTADGRAFRKARGEGGTTRFSIDPEREKNISEIGGMRERVKAMRDSLPKDQDAQETLKQALETPYPANDVFGEEDYLGESKETQAMLADVVPEKELTKFMELERKGKQEVIDNINESAEYEMNRVADIYEEMAVEAQRQAEAQALEGDPNVEVVEKFIQGAGFFPTERFQSEEDLKANHHKEGFSPFAIDPRTLTDAQKKKYLKNEQLKKHKAFVKGGISADDAALLLGANTGDTLLDILSKTPSRQDIIDANVEKNAKKNREEALDSVDLDHTAIAAAYHNRTRNNLAVMKYMVEKSWAKSSKGIQRIALPVPRLEEVQRRAKNAINSTKVGDLSANQFKVGERKSQRIAVKSWLKGDFLKAAKAKEAAALNSELTIETHKAIGEVNRVVKLAKKFLSPSVIQELKDAGPMYENAVDEIMDVFNLNPSRKGESERKSYQKWVQKQIAAGITNFEVPDHLSDVRESLNDMTVEQVKVIGQRLKSVLHQARRKNELWQQFGDPAKELQTLENFAVKVRELVEQNPDYDPNKGTIVQGDLSMMQRTARALSDLTSMIKNAEHILLKADNGQVGGLLNEAIIAPLKGVGKFAGQGEQGKAQDMALMKKQFEKAVIEVIGKDEWSNLQNTVVTVEEFKGSVKLNGGRLTKAQLFMMLLNNGNAGNVDRMVRGFADQNFKTDIETIRKVLERELDDKYAVAAQRVFDMYASYFPRVVKLHEDMAGVTPQMVEAVPFTHKGKVYPGGYYPLLYASEMNAEKLRKKFDKTKDALEGKRQFDLQDHFYADDMTNHRHTERRTSNDQPVNLSINSIGMGFEMILHDLNFRKPIANALKVLTHPTISKDIENVVGKSDFAVVINTVVEAAGSVEMENNILFDSNKIGEKLQAMGRAGLSAGYLIGRWTSIAIQPTSMIYAMERMGVSGNLHVMNTLQKLAGNPNLLVDFYEFAGEIHPAIKATLEGLDDNTRDALSKVMPKKNLSKATKPLNAIREFVNETGYKALGAVDQLQKVIVAISAYSQFINGDAPGFDLDKVRSMSEKELDHHAKVYASSIARLTLTAGSEIDRAPVQKKYKMVSMFFNDARNILNNTMRQGREVKNNVRKKNYTKAARGAAAALVAMTLAKAYIDIIRGNPTPWSSEDEDEDGMAMAWIKYIASAPYDMIVGSIPLARDIKYAIDTKVFKRDRVEVSLPATKMLSDIGTTLEVTWNFMDFVRDERELRRNESKAIGFTLSAASGGLPVNALFDLYDSLATKVERFQNDEPIFDVSFVDQWVERLGTFKEEQAKLPEEERIPEEAMNALDNIRIQLDPPKEVVAKKGAIPDATYAVIKHIESGGNWSAKNPKSSAAGLYQFTEGTWEDVMRRAPELGLTLSGRTSMNTTQQEKAMRWFTAQNVRTLTRNGIEPTIENIYAAHFLGAERAAKVLKSPADFKMKVLISADAMSANDFSNSMRVRDFKTWLATKVSKASTAIASLDKGN